MPYVDAARVSLNYRLEGAGSETIVLLHEMGGTLEGWDRIAAPLARDFRVLRYDLRGHGQSEKIKGSYLPDDAAGDLEALLAALEIERPVILAGAAVGACVALNFAALHPERVSRLVALPPSTGISAEALPFIEGWIARIEADGMRPFVEEEALPNAYPPLLRADAEEFALFRGRQLANDPKSFAATYRMLAASRVREHLHRLTMPVLLLAGTHDVPRSPAFVSKLVTEFPDARMAVVESGHFMASQAPFAVLKAIQPFLLS